jgi:ATP-binding cassette subfamily C (CFTR/MRP) protein 1
LSTSMPTVIQCVSETGVHANTTHPQHGYRHPLESQDVPNIHSTYEARSITADVQAAFHAHHSAGQKNPLWCALYAAFKREFWLGGLCRGTADCLLVLVPFVSRFLIQFVIDSYIAHLRDDDGPPLAHGIGYLAAMVIMLAVQSFAHNHYMYLMSVMGGRTRAILVSSIFEKSANLRGLGNTVPAAEIHKTKAAPDDRNRYHLSGNIINLVTVHCGRIDKTVSAIHMLWTAPLSLGLAIALCEF